MTGQANEPGDPLEGLPPDLARVLRDQSVIVPQDARVFELIASWANAKSDTPSALTCDFGCGWDNDPSYKNPGFTIVAGCPIHAFNGERDTNARAARPVVSPPDSTEADTLLKVVQGVVADAGNVLIPKTASAVDASLRAILRQRDDALAASPPSPQLAETLREALAELYEWSKDYDAYTPAQNQAARALAGVGDTPDEKETG